MEKEKQIGKTTSLWCFLSLREEPIGAKSGNRTGEGMVRLYEKAFGNCTGPKENLCQFMTIVMFCIPLFDKPMGEWYSILGISCNDFILFHIRRDVNEAF